MTWSACLALMAVAALLSGYGGRAAALARKEEERIRKTAAQTPDRPQDRKDRTGPDAGPQRRKGLADILSIPDPLQRLHSLLTWTGKATAEELAAGYREARKRGDAEDLYQELKLVLREWAVRDFPGCFAWARAEGEELERFLVGRQWAVIDPNSALAWARDHWDGSNMKEGVWLAAVLYGLATTDPGQARQALLTLPEESRAFLLNVSIMPEVTSRGLDYTRSWLQGFSDEVLKQRATSIAVAQLSEYHPQECAGLAATLTATKARKDAFGTVASRWAKSDFAAAKLWVEGLPEDTRAKAVGQLVRTWVKTDPKAAGSWLLPIAGDPQLTTARKAYLDELSPATDRETMLNFLAAVPYDAERSPYWRKVLLPWSRQDPAAAQRWIDGHPNLVPPDVLTKSKP